MADQNRIGPETRERIRELWPTIIARLAAGDLIRTILKDCAITDPMKRAYLLTEPNAKAEWDEAREASADAFMDEALHTANTPAVDSAHARTKIDTLKWAARIRNPRLYSDKATLDVNVRTVDLTRIISDAQARLEASRIVGNVALLEPITSTATRLLTEDKT